MWFNSIDYFSYSTVHCMEKIYLIETNRRLVVSRTTFLNLKTTKNFEHMRRIKNYDHYEISLFVLAISES